MLKFFKANKMVTILLPIIFLIGILILQVFTGDLLSASNKDSLVNISIDGKEVAADDIETEKETVELILEAKKKMLLEIPYDESVSIELPSNKKEEKDIEEYSSTEFDRKGLIKEFNESEDKEETTKKTNVFRVINNEEKKKSLFLVLDKEQKQHLKIVRNTKDKTEITALNVEEPKVEQSLLIFKDISPSVDQISKTKELTESKSAKKSAVKKETEISSSKAQTSDTKETSSSETKEKKSESSESKKTTSSSKSEEFKKSKQEDKNKENDSKKETSDSKKVNDKEATDLPKIGTPESYDRILTVETVKTKSSLNELLKDEYKASDSLKKPQYLTNSSESKEKIKDSKTDSPIIVRDVKLEVKTGTSDFDADNEKGHDKDEDNDIVRSFDQVSYLVSFSIQNTKTLTKYKNIRYRVIGELDTAVALEDGVPKNNGEIANGEYIENGDGSQYSQGIMESVITDTGQVFVPIIMNVYGAKHGTELNPSFKLEIVDATNVETGEVETFNKMYTGDDFEQINNAKNEKIKVKVSAKPSVNVKLVAGEIRTGTTVGSTSSKVNAYDVGVTTFLQPLPERTKAGDYRGSTFPTGPITYTVKQRGTYQKKNSAGTVTTYPLTSSQYASMVCVGSAAAINDRTSANWAKNTGVKEGDFKLPLSIPNGITNNIYTSQPTGDLSKIGVYDSGDFSRTATTTSGTPVTNTNYAGVLNPYTYNMEGSRIQSATDKSFSSLELIYSFDKTKSDALGISQGWRKYDMTLYIDSVKYDGYETKKESSITYPHAVTPDGDFVAGPLFVKPNDENNITPDNFSNLELNYTNTDQNFGDARLNQGDTIYFSNFNQAFNPSCQIQKSILMWDPDTFEYDDTKEIIYHTLAEQRKHIDMKFRYGVAKNAGINAPATMNVDNYNYTEQNQYNWYNTPAEAKAKGKISAIDTVAKIDKAVERWVANPRIPIKVIGTPGDKTPGGRPIGLFETSQFNTIDGKIIHDSRPQGAGNFYPYKPTVYDSNGNATLKDSFYNWHGTSAYIKKFNITTKTEVEKSLYNSTEDIDIKVTGVLSGSKSVKYDGVLNTTLPKGIAYKLGSAKDGEGNTLPDPSTITNNSNGTQTLRWTFSNKDLSQENDVEVNFLATSDFTKLTFKSTGYTDSLTVKTVGEMWTTGNTTVKDVTIEKLRSSTDTFIEHLIQQVVLSKDADKPSIEVGEAKESVDPVKIDNSITYDVTLVNQSIDPIKSARILDVLPYDGDSRGTKFNGDYTVEEVKAEEEDINGKKVTDTTAKITFTNTQITDTSKPNDISGWTEYTPGTTSVTAIKNAKAFLVSHPEVAVGNTLKLTIKIQPKNQLAGDVLVNRASMDSLLELPVDSQPVWTRVYGRDLTGYVWYDDNYDGLMDQNTKGEPTDPVKDIAVKLYRTSLEDGSYKKELVKQSLTGEEFIDSSGNSKIKTGFNGKYTFTNLPEGDYLAEFMLGDIVVTQKAAIVTKQLVGSDPKLNSKADPDDFKTPEYTHPVLKDLPTLLTGTDKVHHITDVNAGLARLSRIKLFKYEEGTVIDADGDGKLSAAEIEASTTRSLKGAEFQLYKGKSDNPSSADKIGTVQVTDDKGWLEFDISLPPGDYTIVETKAPDGFELLKNPIHVNVPQYNYVAVVHVADKGQIDLPFTGGTKAMRIILIVSACLLVIGMTGVFLHFRPIKVRGGK